MNPDSSYQPFLIGQDGKSKTGYFTYFDSWVKPEDAFDTLQNAYIYRGSLYQRSGLSLFPSASSPGALVYQNNEIVATGNGGSTYSGILADFPLIGTVTITAKTASGIRTSTATFGAGNRSWSSGGASLATAAPGSTINFTTGVWSINTSATVANTLPITIQYNYVPTLGTTPVNNPIMGIKTFLNEINDTNVLIVLDTRRASYWDTGTKSFVPIASFQQYFYQFPNPNALVTTPTVTLQWTNIAPYSVTVKTFTSAGVVIDTVTDVPTTSAAGTLTASGNISGGAINYTNGTISVTFTVAPAVQTLVQITASVQGDYFSGNNTNFFNSVNWSPAETAGYLYLTNNVDFITRFDGTRLSRPAFATIGTGANVQVTLIAPSTVLLPYINSISKALDVKVYKNRLLFFRPTLTTDFEPHSQGVFYSALNQPLNFVSDIAGNGGDLELPTGDWIMSTQLLRDGIVLFMNNSTWFFRFTANPFDPFRADQLNSSKSTNAPYGSAVYDVTATSMGAKGLIECDGVGVQRYDLNIVDAFEQINQTFFGQCFAQRYDSLNHTWMLYPTYGSGLTTSDSALIYNFQELTWAIFNFNLGNLISTPTIRNTLSCLGLGFTTDDINWSDFAAGSGSDVQGLSWEQYPYPWNYNLVQDLAPSLLAGDQNGFVYFCNDGPTDNPGPNGSGNNGIQTIIQTKRLNPFAQLGTKARFGYLDIYYEVNAAITITMKFNSNNSGNAVQTYSFNMDGPTNETWAWKRFYINCVAEFIQVEITSEVQGTQDDTPVYNTNGVFKILGMILWASPAGRIAPGSFI
jgi:hypothetical protein